MTNDEKLEELRVAYDLQTSRRRLRVSIEQSGGGRYLSQSYENGTRKKLSIICIKVYQEMECRVGVAAWPRSHDP